MSKEQVSLNKDVKDTKESCATLQAKYDILVAELYSVNVVQKQKIDALLELLKTKFCTRPIGLEGSDVTFMYSTLLCIARSFNDIYFQLVKKSPIS